MHYTTKQLTEFRLHSVEILLFDTLAVRKFCLKCNIAMFPVRRGSCAVYKRNTRYRNGFGQRRGKILRITLSGDEEEPRPLSQRSSLSQPPSPDYSASSSEDDDGLAMWQVNKHNPLSGHCPLKPKGVLCMPLLGPPYQRDAGMGLA